MQVAGVIFPGDDNQGVHPPPPSLLPSPPPHWHQCKIQPIEGRNGRRGTMGYLHILPPRLRTKKSRVDRRGTMRYLHILPSRLRTKKSRVDRTGTMGYLYCYKGC